MPGENEDIQNELPDEVIQEATSMGWKPKEEWKGNPDKWIPADEFVEFGSKALPILQHNNKRLQKELLTRDQKIGNLEAQVGTMAQQLEALDKHYSAATKRAVEQSKKQLLTDLREARDSGDVDKEQEILGQLDEVRDALKAADKKQETPNKKETPPAGAYTENLDPDSQAFVADNPWFDTDKKRTRAYLRVVEDMRDEGHKGTGRAFLDEALERLEEQEQGRQGEPQRREAKVESSNGRSSTRTTGGFTSLPPEAKRACHDDADILVGEGKKFKTLKDWETEYAKIYYAS
jgi:hypothetical protein